MAFTLLLVIALLNVNVNCFIPNEWLGLTSPTSRTHAKITESAVLNIAYELLEDNPRPKQPIKPLSKNAPYSSASELIRAYYGTQASTIKFHEAIKDFSDGNANVDFDKSSKKLPSAHFDAETFEESNKRLIQLRQEVIAAINSKNYEDGRRKTGQLFHTLQDFYSHSNWIEMGNTEPHHSIGVPGKTIENIAETTLNTCDDCGLFGRCRNNILTNILSNKKLTSGYCSGQKDSLGKPVTKPDGIGKCSHGGPMDSSRKGFARGGINKDSDNPLISPHYYHHKEAATVATKASQNILRDIRNVVGDQQFMKYLDLYTGGTMCIVIDSTSSMKNDIEAVRNRTKNIIEKRRGSVNEPSKFVLVTFKDPGYGPAFVTEKPDEFLSKLHSINTTDGGDCPENSFHALRLAIQYTDPYSTCFVFTDASANDQYLKESVIALAKYKNVKVKYLLTGSCNVRGQRYSRRHVRATGTIDSSYYDVATSTGGEVISISKGEIKAATSMLDIDLNQSEVTLFHVGQQGVTNPLNGRSHYFTVDSTINEIVIRVKGSVINVKIFNPSGELVKSTGNIFEAVLLLSDLRVIQIPNPTAGRWRVRVRSILTYSVSVTAKASVDFEPSFGVEHQGVHPGVEKLIGKPPQGVEVLILINIIGDNSKLGPMSKIELISSAGEIMKTMPLQTSNDMKRLFVKTILPTSPFQIKVIGSDVKSNPFSRIFSQILRASKCSLKTDRSDVQRILTSGTKEHIPFQAVGEPGTYTVTAIDSAGFIQQLKPNRFVLGKNEQMEGEMLVDIPNDIGYGTSSTVTLIIKSKQSATDFNHFVFSITVQSKELDEVAPSFNVVERLGKCSASKHSCHKANFTVAVEVVDIGMGLYDIITAKESAAFGLTMIDFTPGVPGFVAKAKYQGSCCEPSVELIATDVVGNVGRFKENFLEKQAKEAQPDDMLIYVVMAICGVAALLAVLCACCCCCVVHNRKRSKKSKETTKQRKKIHREKVTIDNTKKSSHPLPKSERVIEIYEAAVPNGEHTETYSVTTNLFEEKYSQPFKLKSDKIKDVTQK